MGGDDGVTVNDVEVDGCRGIQNSRLWKKLLSEPIGTMLVEGWNEDSE